MRCEVIVLNEARNVTLTAYIQDASAEYKGMAKRPAVLILPGGGYQFCSDREADPVAAPYLASGYHAFILRYSVMLDSKWPNPLDDYEQAMSLIRSKAEQWGIFADKTAVIGFSAGGHLAAAAATMSENRPNAAILGYAVTGVDVKACNASAPDTIGSVGRDTCPCFLFATCTDGVVHILNSVEFMKALATHGISFESHIYAYGPHGFSTGDTSVQSASYPMCRRAPNWVADSISWLRDVLGEFTDSGMAPPACKPYINSNYDDVLSVDCTFSHLMGHPAAGSMLKGFMDKMQDYGESEISVNNANMVTAISNLPLRQVLSFVGCSHEDIKNLDAQLKMIPNK